MATMRSITLPVAAVLLLAGCDIGGDEDKSALERAQYVTTFNDLRTPGEDDGLGRVGLTARASKTLVTIEVENPEAPRQEADIRQGNCDVVGGGVVYALARADEGRSQTVVNVPLHELRRAGYIVMVRRAGAPSFVEALCADLAKSRPPDAAPVFE